MPTSIPLVNLPKTECFFYLVKVSELELEQKKEKKTREEIDRQVVRIAMVILFSLWPILPVNCCFIVNRSHIPTKTISEIYVLTKKLKIFCFRNIITEPLVFGPAFAIDTVKGLSWRRLSVWKKLKGTKVIKVFHSIYFWIQWTWQKKGTLTYSQTNLNLDSIPVPLSST